MGARSRRNWWVFLLVGFATALVLSAAGLAFVHLRGERLFDRAAAESEAEAGAFANAVSSWVLGPLPQSHLLSRVVQIALEGDAVYVVISYFGDVLVDERAVGWERADLPATRGEGERTTLASFGGTLILDTVVPVGENPTSRASVRIGTLARYLEVQLRSTELSTAAVAFGVWMLVLLLFTARSFGPRAPAGAVGRPASASANVELQKPVGFPLAIDMRSKTVTYQDQPVPVAPKPFQLLELLLKDRDKVFNEQEIIEHVWADSHYATASDVRQCVYRLRQKLNEIETGLGDCIANVKGFGYRFDPNGLDQQPSEGI